MNENLQPSTDNFQSRGKRQTPNDLPPAKPVDGNSQPSTDNFQSKGKKQIPNVLPSNKLYDLEERTFVFAQAVRAFIKRLPRTVCNIRDAGQLNDASGSVGANYIEAKEALSKKDSLMRLRISRKESKEARYWLRLVDTGGQMELEQERAALIQEASELLMILSSMIDKNSRGQPE